MSAPRPSLVIATFFGAGCAPVAPGTVGTLAALPLVWLASGWSLAWQVGLIALVTVGGMVAAHHAGRHLGVVDASSIVIDEVAGILVAMCAVPFGLSTALAGFVLFRIFDILKPWPVSFFDKKVKNGAGVVLDDVVAGLYARGVLALLMAWWPGLFS